MPHLDVVHDDTSAEDVAVHADEVWQVRVDDDAQGPGPAAQGPDAHVRLLLGQTRDKRNLDCVTSGSEYAHSAVSTLQLWPYSIMALG